jgi:hypothetical protein
MHDCDHAGHRVYARRTFANCTVHICVQCLNCLAVVKIPEHGNRPWIRIDEVPAGSAIHDFVSERRESEQREGGRREGGRL